MSSDPPGPAVNTVHLHAWVDRLRAGDPTAADELLRAVGGRLERLARKMMKGFPNVRRWADTGDVLVEAQLRLLASLGRLRPASTQDFFNLAAVHLRRELIDLARHFGGPRGLGANHASRGPDDGPGPVERAAAPDAGADLDRWADFHAAVERLPAEEREVVGLAFYHGWPDDRVAAFLGMSDRTVRRRWRDACRRLREGLGGDFPDFR